MWRNCYVNRFLGGEDGGGSAWSLRVCNMSPYSALETEKLSLRLAREDSSDLSGFPRTKIFLKSTLIFWNEFVGFHYLF